MCLKKKKVLSQAFIPSESSFTHIDVISEEAYPKAV